MEHKISPLHDLYSDSRFNMMHEIFGPTRTIGKLPNHKFVKTWTYEWEADKNNSEVV